MSTHQRPLKKRLLEYIPNFGVLLAAVALPLTWPARDVTSPPLTKRTPPRLIFVGQAESRIDPTVIALPPEGLPLSGTPHRGLLAFEQALLREAETPAIRAETPPAAPPPAVVPGSSLATRAKQSYGAFEPPGLATPTFPALSELAHTVLYVFNGALSADGFVPPSWSDKILSDASGAWSITVHVRVGPAGGVEDVFLEHGSDNTELNIAVVTLLHRSRFPALGLSRTGTLTVSYTPRPPGGE